MSFNICLVLRAALEFKLLVQPVVILISGLQKYHMIVANFSDTARNWLELAEIP